MVGAGAAGSEPSVGDLRVGNHQHWVSYALRGQGVGAISEARAGTPRRPSPASAIRWVANADYARIRRARTSGLPGTRDPLCLDLFGGNVNLK